MADPHWGPVAKTPACAPKGSRGRRAVKRIFQVLGILVALGLVAAAAVVFIGYTTTKLPNPNKDFKTATTFVYYNDGKAELGNFAIQNRQPLDFKDMPDTIKQAVVAAENRTFWTDKGISLRGMARAAWVIARGGNLQGGSTITQQYIKILYLNSDQTASRKFKELFLAYKINKQLTKEEILEGYLNTIYFGHGAYGIQAASQAFFEVDAKKLTVPQAAVLASVVNNPTPSTRPTRTTCPGCSTATATCCSPWSRPARSPPSRPPSTARAAQVPQGQGQRALRRAQGLPAQDGRAGARRGRLRLHRDQRRRPAGHHHLRQGRPERRGQDAAQKYTEQAADASGEKAKNLHAAIASVDVDSGEVLALYGGPDYVENSRNWATTARPTASTFKAYALAAGLKDGYSLRSTFHGNTFTCPATRSPSATSTRSSTATRST